jgi:thiol-disulfide isomerase/thioredoxin
VDGAGVAVLAATLVLATVVGLVWRRRQGRFREHAARDRTERGRTGRGRTGRNQTPGEGEPMAREEDDRTGRGAAAPPSPGEVLTARDLGADLGERATLVQFSTAFCQPCRATRRILDEVAAMVGGVVHVEVDAEARLDLVRRLDVMRTPTVMVLDASGRVVRRASGQPRKADVIAALGEAVV